MISNADTGVLLGWALDWTGDSYIPPPTQSGMTITTGTGLSTINVPIASDQVFFVKRVLQAQDGSFVGTIDYHNGPSSMIAFDASGSLRWSVPNEQPQIATADGGVIGQSGITYDQNGNATGQIAVATQSWRGNQYRRKRWAGRRKGND